MINEEFEIFNQLIIKKIKERWARRQRSPKKLQRLVKANLNMMHLCNLRMRKDWFRERRWPWKIVKIKIMRVLSKKLSSYSLRLVIKMETTRKLSITEECAIIRWVIFRGLSTISQSPLELREKEVRTRKLLLSIITMLVSSTTSWPNLKKPKSIMIWLSVMISKTEIIYTIEVSLSLGLTTSTRLSMITKLL